MIHVLLGSIATPLTLLVGFSVLRRFWGSQLIARAKDSLGSVGARHGRASLIAHAASVTLPIVLVDLSPYSLPVIAGETTTGTYSGEWLEQKGMQHDTWQCVSEFETAKGLFTGLLPFKP